MPEPEPEPVAAPAATAPVAHVVTVGGEQRTIERMSGLKLARALAIVRAAGHAVPKIVNRVGEFRAEYEASHTIELDRAQALMRYGPRVIWDGDGEPLLDEHGQPRMAPGALAHMTDADWEASGNKLRIPESPGTGETIAALLPDVLDLAEARVYDLLTLFLTPNRDLKRIWRDGTHKDVLADAREDLLADSFADELLELAVVCGELVDEQFTRKTQELGERLGKALRLIGMDPAALSSSPTPTPDQAPQEDQETDGTSSSTLSTEPPSSPATSSTDSPPPTDGPGSSPLTPPPTSSSSSDDDSSTTASSPSAPSSTPSASTPEPAAA